MWMFSHDQSGYFIVAETTEPAQVRLRLTSQLNRIMREWSAQRPSRYFSAQPRQYVRAGKLLLASSVGRANGDQ